MYRYRPRLLAHQKEKEEKTAQTQEKKLRIHGKNSFVFFHKKSFLRSCLAVLVTMVNRE